MTRADIIEMQKVVGTNPDGFWGPKSVLACQRHLVALMPNPNPWPKANYSSMVDFYGHPGDEENIVSIPAPAWMHLYDTDIRVRSIRCHHRVAGSLAAALDAAHDAAPDVVSKFFGCFVNRPMRGGTMPSKHAWGAAIDLDATRNGNRTHWPSRASMPLAVMQAFASEGWLAAGAFWGRDAMHFQATR